MKSNNLNLNNSIFRIIRAKKIYIFIYLFIIWLEAKGDWDFRISDLVKNADGTPVVNFGEVRAQLDKSSILISTLEHLGYIQIFFKDLSRC